MTWPTKATCELNRTLSERATLRAGSTLRNGGESNLLFWLTLILMSTLRSAYDPRSLTVEERQPAEEAALRFRGLFVWDLRWLSVRIESLFPWLSLAAYSSGISIRMSIRNPNLGCAFIGTYSGNGRSTRLLVHLGSYGKSRPVIGSSIALLIEGSRQKWLSMFVIEKYLKRKHLATR